MRDYMMALHDRFRVTSEKSMGLAEKVERARKIFEMEWGEKYGETPGER